MNTAFHPFFLHSSFSLLQLLGQRQLQLGHLVLPINRRHGQVARAHVGASVTLIFCRSIDHDVALLSLIVTCYTHSQYDVLASSGPFCHYSASLASDDQIRFEAESRSVCLRPPELTYLHMPCASLCRAACCLCSGKVSLTYLSKPTPFKVHFYSQSGRTPQLKAT